MLTATHLISHGVTGHRPSDGICLSAFSPSPYSSYDGKKTFPQVKMVPYGSTMSFICNANSSGGQRRNPDFSRQNRQGFSRNKNRHNEDQSGVDGFEDSEVFSSRNEVNGPPPSFLSGSVPPKFQSAATPGPREREIVEIFRKVQAQLRERAAQKEEKKVEDSQSQGHNKQNETVDSLLKLLRKHSGKSTTSPKNNRDFVLDHQSEYNNSFTEDKSPKDLNNKTKHDLQPAETQSFRPASNFQKRSPVSSFKYKPISTGEVSFNREPYTRAKKEAIHEPELTPEVKMESDVENGAFGEFDESSDDEASDIEDTADEIDDSNEVNMRESVDLSGLKLVELREVAKSRGIKGFSRLKKQELLELLTS